MIRRTAALALAVAMGLTLVAASGTALAQDGGTVRREAAGAPEPEI